MSSLDSLVEMFSECFTATDEFNCHVHVTCDEARLRDILDAVQAKPDVERLRTALLNRVRYDNDCLCYVSSPDCTGWDADRCGCAIEARAELKEAHDAQAE